MLDKLNVFTNLVANPVTRKALKSVSSYCEVCGKNRLEVALELFVGARTEACWRCRFAEES